MPHRRVDGDGLHRADRDTVVHVDALNSFGVVALDASRSAPAARDHRLFGEGPVIPLAERAVDTGHVERLVAFLQATVGDEAARRLGHVREFGVQASRGVPAARAYTSAMLGFLVRAHQT